MCDHCSCRENPPIAELSAEHELILAAAWELSEQQRTTGRGDGPVRDRLAHMLAVHVEAEETALYPLLQDCGDLPADQRATLEDEHAVVADALRDGTFDRRTYFELAAHIEEEELELFPRTMFAFDDEDWEVLAASPRFLDAAELVTG